MSGLCNTGFLAGARRRSWTAAGPIVAVIALALWAAGLAGSARSEPLVDRAQLEAWADKYYGQAVAEHRTAGVTVAVVQDGELLFAKGYGYADYPKKTPVSPEETGFIVASVTKTFVATAVVQLADRGAIASLDEPVNKYLKRVKLPGERGAKVTIRQLLTHRAGFEDSVFGYYAPWKGGVPLPADQIERFMPQLVLEPGGASNYSNFGYSLLGVLVEDVSGQPLDAYLKANIWDPLGMSHTSLVYGSFPANLARNYQFKKDGTPVPFSIPMPHPWIVPAGGVVSTATDMAKFMQAQILRGEGGGPAIMSPAMFRELQSLQHRNVPSSTGFAHAFFVGELNGSASIEHGGQAPDFQSMMTIIPEKRFGFFVSAMQGGLPMGETYSAAELAGGKPLVGSPVGAFEMRESFVERFLKPGPVTPPAFKTPDLKTLTGFYWGQRRPFTNIMVLNSAFDPSSVLKVDVAKDGRHLLLNGWGPYRDIGGGVFVSPTGRTVWKDPYTIDYAKPAQIAFSFDKGGKPAYLTLDISDQVWAPASPVFNPRTMLLAAMSFAAVAVTGLLAFLWPHRQKSRRLADGLAAAAALPVLAIPALLLAGFGKDDNIVIRTVLGDQTRFWGMIAAANATVLIALALAAACLIAWRRPATGGWGQAAHRVHLTAVTAAAWGLVVVFWFFNLIGVHMPG